MLEMIKNFVLVVVVMFLGIPVIAIVLARLLSLYFDHVFIPFGNWIFQ